MTSIRHAAQHRSGAPHITLSAAILTAPDLPLQPRARGAATITAKARDGVTVIADLHQSGALKLLFPRPAHSHLEAITINTSGGVTGGDRISLEARALENAHLSITTQAAERIYKAQPDQVGRIENRLSVEAGARIDWLPQETIVFEKSAAKRRLTADLAQDATLLMVEPLVFGRTAMGESLHSAAFHDRIDIRCMGRPLYLDALNLRGDLATHLSARHIAGGAGAMASVVFVGDQAESHLAALRSLLPTTAGASLIAPRLVAARILASDSFELRRSLVPVLRHLTNNALPRSWMT